jgi:uncharacterized membrane protein (DUF4010 family)
MTRLSAILWIVLSVVLLLFPVGIISYYVVRYFKKSSEFVTKKIEEIKELDSMKEVILQEVDADDSHEEQEEEIIQPAEVQEESDVIVQLEAPTV